jgi:hypothetical protein
MRAAVLRIRSFTGEAMLSSQFANPPGHTQPQNARPNKTTETGRSSQNPQNSVKSLPWQVMTGQFWQLT